MKTILELKDLEAGYINSFMLKKVSLAVSEHQVVGILGPNSSGKTTLLKAVSRFIKPDSGSVLLDGIDIWKMRIKSFAQKVAVINQDIEPAAITVFDYVMMGRIPYRKSFQFFDTQQDMKKTESFIELTGIQSISDKLLDSVSGGERQLAQIAKALNQEPALLLMDEPTSHLDIRHQIGILDLVRRYNNETGLTIIMVLHDLNLASEYCDGIILIKNGFIRYSGTPGEILNFKTIEEIYETIVIVGENPFSHKPHVFLVPGEELKKR